MIEMTQKTFSAYTPYALRMMMVSSITINFIFTSSLLDPFVVAYVQTQYTVIESEGQVELCGNLTHFEMDIPEVTVRVVVFNDENSVLSPTYFCTRK